MFSEHDFVKGELDFISAQESDEGKNVRRVQEWISLRGQKILVDGKWGPVTSRALFRVTRAALSGGPEETVKKLNQTMWEAMTLELRRFTIPKYGHQSISAITPNVLSVVWTIISRTALARIAEAGGNNMGPWVRAFMRGHEGKNYPWCAGFVSSVLEIAEDSNTGFKRPFDYTWSSSEMVKYARRAKKLVTWKDLERERPSLCVFAVRGGRTSHQHVGFARAFDYEQGIFETVEGNSNSSASFDGGAVTQGTRGRENKDFILLA